MRGHARCAIAHHDFPHHSKLVLFNENLILDFLPVTGGLGEAVLELRPKHMPSMRVPAQTMPGPQYRARAT